MRGAGGAIFLTAAAMLLPASGDASQTGRRPRPCNVAGSATVNDQEVVQLGTDFEPGRRTGEKLKIGGNVTDIVTVINHSDCPITLSKRDWSSISGTSGEFIEVPPRGSYSGHMWVPWRDGPVGQALWLSIKGRPYFYIWQMSGRLAFVSDAAYQRATANWNDYKANYGRSPNVPGLSTEGGPRILHVATTDDGKPFFKFEGVGEDAS
jgi:hypothetical protein